MVCVHKVVPICKTSASGAGHVTFRKLSQIMIWGVWRIHATELELDSGLEYPRRDDLPKKSGTVVYCGAARRCHS